MIAESHKLVVKCAAGSRARWLLVSLLWLAPPSSKCADQLTTLCSDRAAIERVYYQHRLGVKPPFVEAVPYAAIEELVLLAVSKELALQKTYGVKITPDQLAAEVERINATTKSPEMLAEVKAALANDPEKFANSFAKPILVERELRQRFESDDALHAATRRKCEKVRNEILEAKANGTELAQTLAQLQRAHASQVGKVTWQLGTRPLDEKPIPTTGELEIKKRFGPEARILSSAAVEHSKVKNNHFEDLPADLKKVLSVQVRRVGDVSAVIETPVGFLLYLAEEKTTEILTVSVLSIAKRSYEEWLVEANMAKPSK